MSFSAGPLADTLTALGAAAAIAVLLLVAGAPLMVDLVGPRKRRLPGGAVGTLPAAAPIAASVGTAPVEPVVAPEESGGAPARMEVPAQGGPADAEPAEAPEQARGTLTLRGAAREISLPFQRTALAPVVPLQRPVSRFS
ncbi:hypothetical protein ACQP04_10945 [Pseudonocardia halophobica]|uniref:hypothetical protein n=1 Tax=Pseudonocardia halophobica TaxID=29401 RepID=UPI003D8F66D6